MSIVSWSAYLSVYFFMDFIALRSSNINKRLYVSFSKTPQVYPVLAQSSAQVLKQMWRQGCPNKIWMSFNTLLKFLLPPWFGLVISLSGEVSVQFPDAGKQYPLHAGKYFLKIFNCSYHLKNRMLSFNLCKPQKIFDTFSCIPLVSNVRKLAQASWLWEGESVNGISEEYFNDFSFWIKVPLQKKLHWKYFLQLKE